MRVLLIFLARLGNKYGLLTMQDLFKTCINFHFKTKMYSKLLLASIIMMYMNIITIIIAKFVA